MYSSEVTILTGLNFSLWMFRNTLWILSSWAEANNVRLAWLQQQLVIMFMSVAQKWPLYVPAKTFDEVTD